MPNNPLLLLFDALAALTALQLCYPFAANAAAQWLGRERPAPDAAPDASVDFACVITAYRNAAIALPLIESLLRQSHQRFHVYLVADACTAPEAPHDPRVSLLVPEPALNLKVRSIRYAVERFVRPHDSVVVFDADNLAHPECLAELSRYTAAYACVQGRRTAKNLDAPYAALDALGEFYKNQTDRQAPFLLGSSAVVSGSGMAVRTDVYKAHLYGEAIESGQRLGKKMLQEDKILQNDLVGSGLRIAYAPRAVVYDEKVETAAAVETQRSRWLYSYFQNAPNAWGHLCAGLLRFDANRLLFGVVTLLLPMFLQVALAGVLGVAGLLLRPWATVLLAVSAAVFALNVVWSLRLGGAPPPVWAALAQSPRFVWRQVRALFRLGDPERHFVPTEHRRAVRVDDVMNQP
jgi:cellulose synthase/poly-beta-1,6-N-acetylglucosamine synthase-like glycosyltransferase